MAQDNAMSRYLKKNIVRKVVNFNRSTEPDLLAYIEQIDNVQGYIKNLIITDMQAKQQAAKPQAAE